MTLQFVPRQAWNVHQDVSYKAAIDMGYTESESKQIREGAVLPDRYGLQYTGMTHYAPQAYYECLTYANWAIESFASGDTIQGLTELGCALHYVIDLSVPYHTIPVLTPYLLQHEAYEIYVASNWLTGYNFSSSLATTDPALLYITSDPAQSCMDMKNESYPVFIYAYEIINTYTDWKLDQKLADDTAFLIQEAYYFSKGIIDYVQKGEIKQHSQPANPLVIIIPTSVFIGAALFLL